MQNFTKSDVYQLQVVQALLHDAQTSCISEPIDGKEGEFEWGPKGLKPFDLPAPTAGGDVAAVKAGHVSISALRTGFIQPESKI